MKTNIYQVRDTVADTLIGPIFMNNRDEAAAREFHDALANTQIQLGQHPADFQLWKLGVLDTDDATIDQHSLDLIATGKQWLKANSATAPYGQ